MRICLSGTIQPTYRLYKGAVMLKQGIVMNVELPIKIVHRKRWYVASCPALDIVTQGGTADKAKDNLREALFLFLGSCLERGTLQQVLKDCGFEQVAVPVKSISRHQDRREYINVPLELLSVKGCHNSCHA